MNSEFNIETYLERMQFNMYLNIAEATGMPAKYLNMWNWSEKQVRDHKEKI